MDKPVDKIAGKPFIRSLCVRSYSLSRSRFSNEIHVCNYFKGSAMKWWAVFSTFNWWDTADRTRTTQDNFEYFWYFHEPTTADANFMLVRYMRQYDQWFVINPIGFPVNFPCVCLINRRFVNDLLGMQENRQDIKHENGSAHAIQNQRLGYLLLNALTSRFCFLDFHLIKHFDSFQGYHMPRWEMLLFDWHE